jgi:2-amino-4-hydroxy-6-hydroxymethyldihydropteridine diphosphokinase
VARRVRAYIGLGANVGDTEASLRRAVRALAALPGAKLHAVSPLYRTRPVGVVDQPEFLNAVVALDIPAGPDPETSALALLAALKGLEHAIGRQERERWGPREIDLDLLTFGRHRVKAERPDGRWLEVPHPAMNERLFVLAPLNDIAPGLRPLGWDVSVRVARDRRLEVEGRGAVTRTADWDTGSRSWRLPEGASG